MTVGKNYLQEHPHPSPPAPASHFPHFPASTELWVPNEERFGMNLGRDSSLCSQTMLNSSQLQGAPCIAQPAVETQATGCVHVRIASAPCIAGRLARLSGIWPTPFTPPWRKPTGRWSSCRSRPQRWSAHEEKGFVISPVLPALPKMSPGWFQGDANVPAAGTWPAGGGWKPGCQGSVWRADLQPSLQCLR